MTLIAKPILKNQLWIITDGNNKVGNVQCNGTGYHVKLGNEERYYSSTKALQRVVAIEFERPSGTTKKSIPYAQWPTTGKTYNNMFDVKRKLHIYTKTSKSRCYHAAGWFRVKMNDSWQTMFCPKYIFVQRYEYEGPYLTREEAENN